jgi:hypothetical protein
MRPPPCAARGARSFCGLELPCALHDGPAACIGMQPIENIMLVAFWDMVRTITRAQA